MNHEESRYRSRERPRPNKIEQDTNVKKRSWFELIVSVAHWVVRHDKQNTILVSPLILASSVLDLGLSWQGLDSKTFVESKMCLKAVKPAAIKKY
jgi:hypothetical protein